MHEQLRVGLHLRATTAVKTPHALQLAAAITSGCDSFVTNNRRPPQVAGLQVVQLAHHA